MMLGDGASYGVRSWASEVMTKVTLSLETVAEAKDALNHIHENGDHKGDSSTVTAPLCSPF